MESWREGGDGQDGYKCGEWEEDEGEWEEGGREGDEYAKLDVISLLGNVAKISAVLEMRPTLS